MSETTDLAAWLDSLEETWKTATPGVWTRNGTHAARGQRAVFGWNMIPTGSEVDAALIVAAVNALPELVAALREMREEIAEAEKRGYERGRRDFQFNPSGDNHHNAVLCPYCSPRGDR